MTTKHFRDWTPEDEVIMARQEVNRLQREVEKNRHSLVLVNELADAKRELEKWEAIAKHK